MACLADRQSFGKLLYLFKLLSFKLLNTARSVKSMAVFLVLNEYTSSKVETNTYCSMSS